MSKSDMINHPPHYTFGEKYEVIDVIDDWELSFGFCIGSAIKYIARAQHKGNRIEDLKKAKWYINHLMEYITNYIEQLPLKNLNLIQIKRIFEFDVVNDWKLDEHEGMAIRRLGQAAELGRDGFWAEAYNCLILARNQVTLAIGKLTT